MILLHGEQILIAEHLDRVRGGNDQRHGTLFLTNYRIVFEEKINRGLLAGQTTRTALDAPIERVSNVLVDQRAFGVGRPILKIEFIGHDGFMFKTPAAAGWAARIAQLRASIVPRAPAPSPPASYHGAPVVVNVQAPQAAPPQSFLHCRYCGALTPAGAAQGAMKCSGCGAAL